MIGVVVVVVGFIACYLYYEYRDRHPAEKKPKKQFKKGVDSFDRHRWGETLSKALDSQGTISLSLNSDYGFSQGIFKSEWLLGITVLWEIDGFRITRSVEERAVKRNPERMAKETVRVLRKKRELLEENRKQGKEIAENACPSCGQVKLYDGKECGRCGFTE